MGILFSIRLVLGYKNYLGFFLLCTLVFWILFGWLLGLSKLPLFDWVALQNSVVWELFLPNLLVILLAGALNALLLTLTVFRLKELQSKMSGAESKTGLLGVGLTGVFAACPFCAVSLASVFGVSFVSAFIAPYYLAFQAVALGVVLLSLHWTARQIGTECIACGIGFEETKKSVKVLSQSNRL